MKRIGRKNSGSAPQAYRRNGQVRPGMFSDPNLTTSFTVHCRDTKSRITSAASEKISPKQSRTSHFSPNAAKAFCTKFAEVATIRIYGFASPSSPFSHLPGLSYLFLAAITEELSGVPSPARLGSEFPQNVICTQSPAFRITPRCCWCPAER